MLNFLSFAVSLSNYTSGRWYDEDPRTKSTINTKSGRFSPPFIDKYRTGMIIKSVDSIFKEYFNRVIKKRANQTNDTLLVLVKVNSIIKKVANKFMGLI